MSTTCEHVLAPPPSSSPPSWPPPRVRVIATSREPLSVGGEHVPARHPGAARRSTPPRRWAGPDRTRRCGSSPNGPPPPRVGSSSPKRTGPRSSASAVASTGSCSPWSWPRSRPASWPSNRSSPTLRPLRLARFGRVGGPASAPDPADGDRWSYGLLTDEGARPAASAVRSPAGSPRRRPRGPAPTVTSRRARPVCPPRRWSASRFVLMTELVGPVACHRLHETMREVCRGASRRGGGGVGQRRAAHRPT